MVLESSFNALFIMVTKVAGALVIPKFMNLHSNNPNCILKAVLVYLSLGSQLGYKLRLGLFWRIFLSQKV